MFPPLIPTGATSPEVEEREDQDGHDETEGGISSKGESGLSSCMSRDIVHACIHKCVSFGTAYSCL